MATRDARIDLVDVTAGHQFGFLHRALNRLHGRFDVYDHTLLQASRTMGSDADHLDVTILGYFPNNRRNLTGANIQANDEPPRTFMDHQLTIRVV